MKKKNKKYIFIGVILILIIGAVYFVSPKEQLLSVANIADMDRAIAFQGYTIIDKNVCTQQSTCDYQGLNIAIYNVSKDGVYYKVLVADLKTAIPDLLQVNPYFSSCGSFTGYLDNKPSGFETSEFRNFNAVTQLYHKTVYLETVQSGAYLYCTNDFVIMTWDSRILEKIK